MPAFPDLDNDGLRALFAFLSNPDEARAGGRARGARQPVHCPRDQWSRQAERREVSISRRQAEPNTAHSAVRRIQPASMHLRIAITQIGVFIRINRM